MWGGGGHLLPGLPSLAFWHLSFQHKLFKPIGCFIVEWSPLGWLRHQGTDHHLCQEVQIPLTWDELIQLVKGRLLHNVPFSHLFPNILPCLSPSQSELLIIIFLTMAVWNSLKPTLQLFSFHVPASSASLDFPPLCPPPHHLNQPQPHPPNHHLLASTLLPPLMFHPYFHPPPPHYLVSFWWSFESSWAQALGWEVTEEEEEAA